MGKSLTTAMPSPSLMVSVLLCILAALRVQSTPLSILTVCGTSHTQLPVVTTLNESSTSTIGGFCGSSRLPVGFCFGSASCEATLLGNAETLSLSVAESLNSSSCPNMSSTSTATDYCYCAACMPLPQMGRSLATAPYVTSSTICISDGDRYTCPEGSTVEVENSVISDICVGEKCTGCLTALAHVGSVRCRAENRTALRGQAATLNANNNNTLLDYWNGQYPSLSIRKDTCAWYGGAANCPQKNMILKGLCISTSSNRWCEGSYEMAVYCCVFGGKDGPLLMSRTMKRTSTVSYPTRPTTESATVTLSFRDSISHVSARSASTSVAKSKTAAATGHTISISRSMMFLGSLSFMKTAKTHSGRTSTRSSSITELGAETVTDRLSSSGSHLPSASISPTMSNPTFRISSTKSISTMVFKIRTTTPNEHHAASSFNNNYDKDAAAPTPLNFIIYPAGDWTWSPTEMSAMADHLYSQSDSEDHENDPYSFFNRREHLFQYVEKLAVTIDPADGSISTPDALHRSFTAMDSSISGEMLAIHFMRDSCYDPHSSERILVDLDAMLTSGMGATSTANRPVFASDGYGITVDPDEKDYRKKVGLAFSVLTCVAVAVAWYVSGTCSMPLIVLGLLQLKIAFLNRLCIRSSMSDYVSWSLWVLAPSLQGDVFTPMTDNQFGAVLIHFLVGLFIIFLFMVLTKFRQTFRLSFPRVPLTVATLLQTGLVSSGWYNLVSGHNKAMRAFSFILTVIFTLIMFISTFRICWKLPSGLALLPYTGSTKMKVLGAYVPEQLVGKYSIILDAWLPPGHNGTNMGTRAALLHLLAVHLLCFLSGFMARKDAEDCMIVIGFAMAVSFLYAVALLWFRPCRWRVFLVLLVCDTLSLTLLQVGALTAAGCGGIFPQNRVFGEAVTVISLVASFLVAVALVGCTVYERIKLAKSVKKEKENADARKRDTNFSTQLASVVAGSPRKLEGQELDDVQLRELFAYHNNEMYSPTNDNRGAGIGGGSNERPALPLRSGAGGVFVAPSPRNGVDSLEFVEFNDEIGSRSNRNSRNRNPTARPATNKIATNTSNHNNSIIDVDSFAANDKPTNNNAVDLDDLAYLDRMHSISTQQRMRQDMPEPGPAFALTLEKLLRDVRGPEVDGDKFREDDAEGQVAVGDIERDRDLNSQSQKASLNGAYQPGEEEQQPTTSQRPARYLNDIPIPLPKGRGPLHIPTQQEAMQMLLDERRARQLGGGFIARRDGKGGPPTDPEKQNVESPLPPPPTLAAPLATVYGKRPPKRRAIISANINSPSDPSATTAGGYHYSTVEPQLLTPQNMFSPSDALRELRGGRAIAPSTLRSGGYQNPGDGVVSVNGAYPVESVSRILPLEEPLAASQRSGGTAASTTADYFAATSRREGKAHLNLPPPRIQEPSPSPVNPSTFDPRQNQPLLSVPTFDGGYRASQEVSVSAQTMADDDVAHQGVHPSPSKSRSDSSVPWESPKFYETETSEKGYKKGKP